MQASCLLLVETHEQCVLADPMATTQVMAPQGTVTWTFRACLDAHCAGVCIIQPPCALDAQHVMASHALMPCLHQCENHANLCHLFVWHEL